MITQLIKLMKEMKSTLIIILTVFILIGAGLGFTGRAKKKIREINPKTIYRERVLDESSNMLKNQDSSGNFLKSNPKENLFSPQDKEQNEKALQKENKKSSEIEKTQMDDLLEKTK